MLKNENKEVKIDEAWEEALNEVIIEYKNKKAHIEGDPIAIAKVLTMLLEELTNKIMKEKPVIGMTIGLLIGQMVDEISTDVV